MRRTIPRGLARTTRLATALSMLCGTLLSGTIVATPAHAAITFSKTVDKTAPAPGEQVTYTLSYTCSTSECVNGEIVDALPPGMEFVGWTPDASTVDIAGSTVPPAGTVGGEARIKLVSPLAPGTTATVKVVLKYPNFTTANGQKATNTATFTADGEQPQKGEATTTAVVQPKYDVSKGVQSSSQDGRTVTYQFGACSKDGVPNVDLDTSRLVDTLPPGAVGGPGPLARVDGEAGGQQHLGVRQRRVPGGQPPGGLPLPRRAGGAVPRGLLPQRHHHQEHRHPQGRPAGPGPGAGPLHRRGDHARLPAAGHRRGGRGVEGLGRHRHLR
ncbi:DUF11 domain-containing protein [Kitasatospora albolonga]|uniref:DUF11 domain-containing protein n=1 Tax=Kitasatospora albolonga TaxID=68173 RepID=UPI0031ECD29B